MQKKLTAGEVALLDAARAGDVSALVKSLAAGANVDARDNLEELICNGVRGMSGVILNETVRLRALELSPMSGFRSIEPLGCFSEELRVVTLDRVRKLNPEWLRYAHKLECIALRLGSIPTIRFLKSLKRLQVLDLFGSKVLDGDLSLRDSLPQQMDAKSWGCSK